MNPAVRDKRREREIREIAELLRGAGTMLLGAAALIRGGRELGNELRRLRRRRRESEAVTGRTLPRPFRRHDNKMVGDTITLYRPVGQKERDLIEESGWSAFPPRLPEQPIFYPVLNEEYAAQIAGDWNTKDAFSGYAGYVTRFAVRADYLANYEVHMVGASEHQEYWIPAQDLPAFNENIVGPIEVIATYRGEEP